MDGNSGECTQSPSSSQGLKCAKEDGSTSLPHNDSKEEEEEADDDYNYYSGTGDSRLTNKPDRTKENIAPPYWNSLIRTELQKYYHILPYIAVPIIVFAFGYLCSICSTVQDTEKIKNNEMCLIKETIERIREEFPSQLEHIWVEFSAGIKATAQGTPKKPSVFMLLYETEEGTASCLAQKVGNMSTQLLDAKESDPLLIIDGADLEHNETLAEDYGTLLEEYRPKVEKQRAMVIINLHKVPGTVAQSFHSFCDTVTPAVEKAVYLFTMKASGISNRHNPTEVAEQELKRLWSDELDEDILNPLITRITDVTMMIRPEKNLAPC